MSTKIANYRPDIDGLRAVAVVSVLLFHAFPSVLPGGFVGVDIFFVISGYLISSILIKETQQGRFSVLQFYIRRARRLFPALLVMLAGTLVVGWLMLFPGEWRALGKHTLAGAAFLSNLALWQEAGYFDGSSDLKPLLHLWSLAVEEQFYLVWPMIIFVVGRRSTRVLGWVTLGLIAISLGASAVLSPHNPTMAFYFPGTRFWELMVGSALAIWQAQHPRRDPSAATPWQQIGSGVGLAALLISIATFHSSMAFPGYVAALPVIGSALLIACGPLAWANRWVLAQKLAVAIGLISYPLYLWHWPLLVMGRLWAEGQPVAPLALLGLLAVSFALAWLTYRFVEGPLRDSSRTPHAARDARHLWLVLLALGAIGMAAWKHILPSHSEHYSVVQKIDQAEADWESIGNKSWAGGKPGTVLFVGDSHMEHYAPRIAEVMQTQAAKAHSVKVMALSGCTPIPGIDRRTLSCAPFMDRAYAAMQAPDVTTIVLAASWKGFAVRPDYYRVGDPRRQPIAPMTDSAQWVLDAWSKRLRQLVQAGKHVVVVLSSPRGDDVEPKHFVHRSWWTWQAWRNGIRSEQELKAVVQDVDARIAAAARAAGAEVIDPFQDFCHDSLCQVASPDGAPIFMDDSHIRATYAHDHVHVLDPYFFRY
ncbi:MAG: acyltransferase [Burkholderiales bacterium]|nr:acyltransferase [Burkholderiales bacterium]